MEDVRDSCFRGGAGVRGANLIYIWQLWKFRQQKLKNGFTAGDERWHVHSRRTQALSDVDPCFVLKVTKLRKKYRPAAKAMAAAAALAVAVALTSD